MQALTRRCTAPGVQAAMLQGLGGQQPLLAAMRQSQSRRAYSSSHFTTEYTLSTDDRLEILELCHKFDHALNAGQQDKLGAFFAPDAQVVTPLGAVKGVGPILDYFAACKPMAAGNRHLTCDVVVEAVGVRAAKATAYRLLHKCCCPPVLLASGVIEDQLVSINGEWRFSQRTFVMDPPAAAAPAAPAAQQPQKQDGGGGGNGALSS